MFVLPCDILPPMKKSVISVVTDDHFIFFISRQRPVPVVVVDMHNPATPGAPPIAVPVSAILAVLLSLLLLLLILCCCYRC